MHGRVACVVRGMDGRVACVVEGVHGKRYAWQERQPLQQTVCILLECILVR